LKSQDFLGTGITFIFRHISGITRWCKVSCSRDTSFSICSKGLLYEILSGPLAESGLRELEKSRSLQAEKFEVLYL